ncbi:MAG: patatin-like phospholipase family protein [Microcoleus sp. SM1_3_4]|nr:patatin-like phospholipase family protein [Microcoleus sp. SM1_3_4]
MTKDAFTNKKSINLALQGGGAHGAYTWGILDAFLEDGRLSIEGISATSAGSINAVALASGLCDGGTNKDARTVLHEVWRRMNTIGAMCSPIKKMPWEKAFPWLKPEESPSFLAFEMATRVMSPYQFNPLGFNPIRQVIEQEIDFDALKNSAPVKLFLSATCVETGDARIFPNDEINVDVVVASTSLPFLYQAVEINGWHY